MAKDVTLNSTLNKVILEVFTGADYVSKIALAINKSIPVVHRQLDVLYKFGILSKNRVGKKISYSLNWENISDIMTSALLLDYKKFSKSIQLDDNMNELLKELKLKLKTLPNGFTSQKTISEEFFNFFQEEKILVVFSKYLQSIKTEAINFSEYERMNFNESVLSFLELIGLMDDKKIAKLFDEDILKEYNALITFCKIRALQRKILDPKTQFLI